jgi:purple acid phosphatase-like protein
VRWSTDDLAQVTVEYGLSSTSLTNEVGDSDVTTEHEIGVPGLKPGTRYYARVVSRNALGVATSPTLSFVTPDYGVADSRIAQWRTGTGSGVSENASGDGQLQLEAGARSGSYVSRLQDAQQMVGWRRATWDADVPSGASVTIGVRTGSTSTPDATWTPWLTVPSNGASLANLVKDSRYLQYRVDLTGSDTARPVVRSIGFSSTGTPLKFETETGRP